MMKFLEILSLMMYKHSLMLLALSIRGYTLTSRCAYFQKPLMSQGDWSSSGERPEAVLSSYLQFKEEPISMWAKKFVVSVIAMLDRWAELEALRVSIANIQAILSLLQRQTDQLRESVDFHLEPLAQEVEELRQRWDGDTD
jgi:hypothetical protein